MSRPRLTFYCEMEAAPLQVLFSLPDMAVLADLKASLSLGIMDLTEARAEVVQRLNTAGIPVIAWLLLPKEQGYWFNLDNAEQAARRYAEFKEWTETYGLRWDGIGLDIEPDLRDMERLAAERWRMIPLMLRRLFNRQRLRRAARRYRDLVEQIRRDGYRIDSYQFPFIVDERLARSNLLQKVTGLVDVASDREVLMLYSSFVRPYGPGLLWSYGRHAQAIGVGSTGGGVELDGLNQRALEWGEFARDLRLAWVFTDDIYIFSLEGCVRQGFLTRLRDFQWDKPIIDPVIMAARVDRLRASLKTTLWLGSHPIALSAIALGILLFILGVRRRLSR
jgi:hypothetical protein